MTYDFHDDTAYEPAPAGRRWPLIPIAVLTVLAIIGVASAFLWRAYGSSLPALPALAFQEQPTASTGAVTDRPVGLKDFEAFQQEIARSMQSTEQLLAAQQAETRRLSDQLTLLSGRVDLLNGPAASVEGAPPSLPVAPAPRKKRTAPKPAGAISVGGAALTAPAR